MKISIEGNIGSGKSTLLNNLLTEYKVIHEDIKEWKLWIEEFYKDREKNSFGFQMRVLLSQSYIHFKNEITFHERSPYTCNYIFGELLKKEGFLSNLEYDLCLEFADKYCWKPDIVIYIQTNPEICHERINLRAREGENIPIEYLKDLHIQHEKIYNSDKKIKVYIVDGNQNESSIYQNVQYIIKEIYMDNYVNKLNTEIKEKNYKI